MAVVTLKLPRLHAGQTQIKANATRYNVAACGRRFGKTFLAHELIADTLLDGQPVGYFAPTYKLLIDVWDRAVNRFKPIIKRSNATERRIETLIPGGVLEMWTMEDIDAGRSRKYQRVIVDEAGLVADLRLRWTESIRPTLADLRGDAWLMGTPKGRNFFWECYQRGLDETQADWRSWQLPTSCNPYISADEIEAMRHDMSERSFRQEILAEFLDDGGGVFRFVLELSDQQPASPVAGHVYIVGADWARSEDYTAFSVIDATTCQQVHLDRFTNIGYEIQRERLVALIERFKPAMVYAEYNSMGGPIVERLQSDGYSVHGFKTSSQSKQGLIDALALALERQQLHLLSDDVQQSELVAYQSETLPSGAIRYGAPEGMHDDTVIALALAWHGAKRYQYEYTEETHEETEEERWERIQRKLNKGRQPATRQTGWN